MKKILISTLLAMYLSITFGHGECYGEIHTVVPYLISLKTIAGKTESSTETKEEVEEEKIQNFLYVMNHNAKNLETSLETYSRTMTTVQNLMAEKAKNKQAFSEEQILNFQNLSDKVSTEYQWVQNLLSLIHDKKDLKLVQQEILKPDSNYTFILDSLEEIILYQELALQSAALLIQDSKDMLNILL